LEDIVLESGALDEAYQKQVRTFDTMWKILQNNLNVVMIELGNIILPSLTSAAMDLVEWLDRMKLAWEDPTTRTAIDDFKTAVSRLWDAVVLFFGTLTGAPEANANIALMTPSQQQAKDVENMSTAIFTIADAINKLADALNWLAGAWPKVKDAWQGIKDWYKGGQLIPSIPSSPTGKYSQTATPGYYVPWKKQAGGYISMTKPYLLHQGEQVIPSGMRTGMGGQGQTIIINIKGGITTGGQMSIDELKKELGKAVQLARMGV